MASATFVTSLEEEVNCPICQGSLREPVTIDCGHNFCRGCLTRYCEIPGPAPEEPPACPLCKEPFRPGSFRPNWQLASVVESIQRHRMRPGPGAEEDACPEHGEKVYFFCEEDEAQLCVVCRAAAEHRAHSVRFLEEAAGPYRVGGASARLPGSPRQWGRACECAALKRGLCCSLTASVGEELRKHCARMSDRKASARPRLCELALGGWWHGCCAFTCVYQRVYCVWRGLTAPVCQCKRLSARL